MANFFMRFPEGRRKALTLSYDDGMEQDAKLIDIMHRHGLKGTFNLNSGCYTKSGTTFKEGEWYRRLTKDAATELFTDCGMEIAVHTYSHPCLEQLPVNAANLEIARDRELLEEQFDRIVRGAAYPYGTYSDRVVELLADNDIAYCRTVWSSNNFDIPTDWLRLRPTAHHNDPRLWELTDRFLNENPWSGCWMFYLWGHTYEFEHEDNWDLIEKFAEKTGGREDIWYATNIEIYDYTEAFKLLKFSSDLSRVSNPTAYRFWFEYDGKMYTVEPGETKKLF